jgi:dolichyl-diphosphooligosaccharide--protein glycosyltransferase
MILSSIIILAVLVRFLPFEFVFDKDSVYFFDGDCSLHLRKIFLHIHNFPSFITFDYFDGYPVGTSAITPPLLDYLLSVISLLVGFGSPTNRQVEIIAAIAPVFIGGLTVLAVYYYTKCIFNKKIALIASGLLAIMPANFIFSIVGRPDNEMMEPLMITILFYGYLRMQLSSASGERGISVVFWTSIAALLSLLFWRGSTLWILLVASGVLIDITIDFFQGKTLQNRHFQGAGLFLLLATFLFIFCIFNIWGNQDTFSYNIISWFHVSVFATIAFGIFTYGVLCEFWLKRNFNQIILFVLLAILGVILISIFSHFLPVFSKNITAGMGIIGIGNLDPWIQSINEYQPLINWNDFSFSKPTEIFGWAFWIFPIIIAYLIFDMHKGRWDRDKIFFVFVSVLLLLLTLLRTRFQHILAINIAITSGWLLFKAYHVVAKMNIWQSKNLAFATTIFLVVIIFYPVGISAYSLRSNYFELGTKNYIQEAMSWLRENTLAPEDPYNPTIKPAYSVMARWDFGGWITYHAQRPVVATPYGSETYGLKESVAFYLAENEAEANAIMDKTKAKYALAVNVIGALGMFTKIADVSLEDYAQLTYSPKFGKVVYQPRRQFFNLISSSLLFVDGMETRLGNFQFKGVDHYRLVYESVEKLELMGFPFQVSKLKIFEYLPGALLKIKTSPGQKISVVSKIITNRKRIFEFKKEATAGSDGLVTFVLPYAEPTGRADVGAIEPYKISSTQRSIHFTVSEEDIKKGKQFAIDIH